MNAPSLLRSLRPLLALAAPALLAALAPAQGYPGGPPGGPGGPAPTGFTIDGDGKPTGGTATNPSPGPPTAYQWDGSTYSGTSTGMGSDSCSGAVHYAWTWHGPGPAPSAVVLKVQAHAQWSGPPGSCDDGLGLNDPKQDSYAGPTLVSQQQNGVGYVVKSVGAGGTVTYDVTPTAGATSSTCNVSVKVSLTPVVLTLTGPKTTASGGYECMIGRGVTGSISAGGYEIDPSSYRWTVGGSNFFNYVADNDAGTLYNLTEADLHGPYPQWFWKVEGEANVYCTVTVDFPDGTIASVSAQTTCTVVNPKYGFDATLVSHQLYYAGDVMGTGDPTSVVTWDPVATPNFNEGHCIEFGVAVNTPTRFREGGDSGTWCLVQLAKIYDRTICAYPMTYPIIVSTDGRYDLDNEFPYRDTSGSGGSSYVGGAVSGVDAVDGPSLSLPYNAASFQIDDSYHMYLLYRPPGNNTAWVPLGVVKWECFGRDVISFGTSGTAVPGSYVRITEQSPTSVHPEWTDRYGNQNEGSSSASRAVKKKSKQAKP